MSYIVLKFDDLNADTLPYFTSLHEYCKGIGTPVCFGLIGDSLYSPSKDYVIALKRMMTQGVELWNHGYHHTETEFSTNHIQQQKYSIQATQDLFKQCFGSAASTFGSPHNNSTENTVKVLSKSFPEITNYFYMVDGGGVSSARQLLMRCNYEIKTGVVDLDFFRKEYNRIKEYPYFVMQGHPSFWHEEDFDRFKEMIAILLEDRNEFITAEGLANKDISGYRNNSFKIWSESIENFYASHDRVFYYGAGEIGREVYKFMSMRGLKPYGFVVSDGRRDITDICNVPVYELSEVRNEAYRLGIVPTLLGRTHKQILGNSDLSRFDIWMPGSRKSNKVKADTSDFFDGDTLEYDRFIDFVRYELSLSSW